MYTNLYFAEEVHQIGKSHLKQLSPVVDAKSPRSDCNSAAGLFLWRQAQPSSWVEKITQH